MVNTSEYETFPDPTTMEEARDVIRIMSERIKALLEVLAREHDEARHDVLIRTMLNKAEIERVIEQRIGEQASFGILLIDVNCFKLVNDHLGHLEGDRLLKSLGTHLHEGFQRRMDEIRLMNMPEEGRIGGDEFVVVVDLSDGLEDDRRESDPARQMVNLYEFIKNVEAEVLEESPAAASLGVGLSVGIAIFNPEHPTVTAAELIKTADGAMYEEKRRTSRQRA